MKIEKEYVFDGPDGKVSLADLFEGRSQLIVYHFMLEHPELGKRMTAIIEKNHVEVLGPWEP